MIVESAPNYMAPFVNKLSPDIPQVKSPAISKDMPHGMTTASIPSMTTQNDLSSMYRLNMLSSPSCRVQTMPQAQYPPQTSSTGSASPHSNMSSSVSPAVFPSPPYSTNSQNDFSTGYTWNAYTGLSNSRSQFSYHQYASEYYGNMGMSSAGSWFSQDRLYATWPSNSYGFNLEDIAFQTQLQRRSVRCTCPNCTNEMSGLPPIVGPDERGRKQHICHIPGCERLYGKASHLKTHLRWHTGERPFLCLTCGKRFSRSDELQRHGRTHTNYRPYSCPLCVKKFSRSDHLSKHKKTHFKDKKSKKIEKETPKKENEVKGVAHVSNEEANRKPQDRTVNSLQSDSIPVQNNAFLKAESSTSHNEVPSGYSYIYPSTQLFHGNQHMGLYYNRTDGPHATEQANSKQVTSSISGDSCHHFNATTSVNQGAMQAHSTEYNPSHHNQTNFASQMRAEYPYPDFSNSSLPTPSYHWSSYHPQANQARSAESVVIAF